MFRNAAVTLFLAVALIPFERVQATLIKDRNDFGNTWLTGISERLDRECSKWSGGSSGKCASKDSLWDYLEESLSRIRDWSRSVSEVKEKSGQLDWSVFDDDLTYAGQDYPETTSVFVHTQVPALIVVSETGPLALLLMGLGILGVFGLHRCRH